MNHKIRILFVHSQLVQHGSERYLYEICKGLDKDRFEIHILTRFFLVRNNFYFSKLLDIGCEIHTKLLSIRHLRYPIKFIFEKYNFIRVFIKFLHSFLVKIIYNNFFDRYDVIAVVGIETYCDALAPLLDNNNNVVIHHVNHQFQFERNYFDECKQKNIVILDDQQRQEIIESKISDALCFFLPLPMSFDNFENIGISKVFNRNHKRIAVFSRLFKDRPNEPLFRCFSEFKKVYPNSEMYFYGDGDSSQYSKLLSDLGILDHVIFRGHSKSISTSIINDKIDILWLVSMGKSISYSSIEISAFGMPMVFWNLNEVDNLKILDDTNGAINSFNNLKGFIDFNLGICDNEKELKRIGQNIRRYVINYYDLNNNIKNLEKYYLTFSKSNNDK
jgi:glycosyltransferase involved in cell wall biosynthesis